MQQIETYIHENRDRFLEELFTLLRQRSISATGEGVEECAQLLANMMRKIGISTRILPWTRNPFIFGEVSNPAAEQTVLIYGHYDVQPPDPLDEWTSPPFEPEVRDGKIFARGAGDNKGQHFANLKAIESILQTKGQLPVNVKLLLEGEEEIGSPNLATFVEEHKERLACDLVYCADGHMHYGTVPEIIFGVRGILYLELIARGANRDLHSGMYGGVSPNPNERLARLLTELKAVDNHINIDGFYDDVLPPTDLEREALRGIPYTDDEILSDLGISEIPGDRDISSLEKLMFQPTLNANGFRGGYLGEGSKTIIPRDATLKIDIRLVANQDPEDIFRKFTAFLHKHGYGDIEVIRHGTMPPCRTPLDHPIAKPVIEAVKATYGGEPRLIPCLGGSLPNAAFEKILKAPNIFVPYAQTDENNHAPNERLALENFYWGIRTMAHLLYRLADGSGKLSG